MKLKDLTDIQDNSIQENSDEIDDLIADELVESSIYYMIGMYHSYCMLKKIKAITPENVRVFLTEVKEKNFTEDELKEYIKTNENTFSQFFNWYMFEEK